MANTVTLTLSVDDAQLVARVLRIGREALFNAAADGTLFTDWAPSVVTQLDDLMGVATRVVTALDMAALNAVEIEAL